MTATALKAPTVDTEINVWPGIIDMMTSLLMFFMLIYFVQHNVNPATLSAEIARQKQQRFNRVFESEFAGEIKHGDIRLSADLNLLQITFGDQILFTSGHYDLQPRGETMLRRLARIIAGPQRNPATPLYDQIQIEGHTDNRPLVSFVYPHDNWELSTARALEVLRFLNQRCTPPLDERAMSANGYAGTRPVDRRTSRNRRIEIRIYFSGREQK